jgi:TonB family protein
VNKARPSERLSGLLAFVLSTLVYIAVTARVVFLMKTRPPEPRAVTPAPLTLRFAQIELQAAAEPPPEPVVEVRPDPAPAPEEIEPEPPPEPIDVVPDEPPEMPPAEPEPVSAAAQITQEASAPAAPPVDRNVLFDWVREQVEQEKYYPPSARNAGYEGAFRLQIEIGVDGRITAAAVLGGQGHPMLRRALEKMMLGLIGRDFGQSLPAPVELPFDFEFKLQ